jgi:hypothetical protein
VPDPETSTADDAVLGVPLTEAASDDPEADEADRAEQAAAGQAAADGLPGPLPESALDGANDADVAEQSIPVPLDEDDYR